jgi:DNA-binding XRE family transcriptional regulator
MNVTDARQLKAARVIAGMTIDDLAAAAGINRNSILRVEKQTTLPNSAYAADRIRKALEAMGFVFEIRDGKAAILFVAAARRTHTPYQRKLSR